MAKGKCRMNAVKGEDSYAGMMGVPRGNGIQEKYHERALKLRHKALPSARKQKQKCGVMEKPMDKCGQQIARSV